MQKFLLSIFSLAISIHVHAQQKFHVDFHAENCSVKRELSFFFDNGEKTVPAQVNQQNQEYSIEGSYFGKFAILEIREKIDNTSFKLNRYLLNEITAKIRFTDCKPTSKHKYWQDIYTENAIDFISFYKNLREFSTQERIKFDQEQEKLDEFFKHKPLPDMETILKVKKESEEALTDYYNKQFEFITLHASDYRAFVEFRDIINQRLVLESNNVLSVFNAFPSDIKDSFEGKKLYQLIVERRTRFENSPEIGKKAPNFQTTDISENNLSLMDFKGKYVLLVFWATWCGPCVEEIPLIKSIRNKYKPSDLSIIYFSQDKDKDKMLSFIKKKKMNWTHIFGDTQIMKDYYVDGIPKTILIDSEGKIVYMRNDKQLDGLEVMLSENIK